MFDEIQKTVKELEAAVKNIKKELSDSKSHIQKLEGRVDILSMLQKKQRSKK